MIKRKTIFLLILVVAFALVGCKKDKKNEFTVTFNLAYDGLSFQEKVVKDTKVNEPLDPTRTGYEFAGWYLDTEKFDFETLITKNITLNAMWNDQSAAKKEVQFKDGINSFSFSLNSFKLSAIQLEVKYPDGTIEYVKVNKDMISEEDLLMLFTTGTFYLSVNYENKIYRALVAITSDEPQTTLPQVLIYSLKEEVDGKVVYTYYAYASKTENYTTFGLELNLGENVNVILTNKNDGLFSYNKDSKKIDVIYSFGKVKTGHNLLFSISYDQDFDLEINDEKIEVYGFDEVVYQINQVKYYSR